MVPPIIDGKGEYMTMGRTKVNTGTILGSYRKATHLLQLRLLRVSSFVIRDAIMM